MIEYNNDVQGKCPDCGADTEVLTVADKYQGEIINARTVNALCEECMVDRATHPV